MDQNWKAALEFVWRPENDGQGYHVTPHDPGAGTNMGVTAGTWAAAQQRKLVPSHVTLQHAARGELALILHEMFWQTAGCDRLPAGVSLVVFNMAMVAGPGHAVRLLQATVGAEEDGVCGPRTLAAVQRQAPEVLIPQFTDACHGYFAVLPSFARFGHGWVRRASDAEAAAVALIPTVVSQTYAG